MNKKIIYTIATGIAIAALPTFAQTSSDEIAALSKRIEALESGNKASSWGENVKIKGDVRYRYEYKADDGDTTDNRHRFRARVGAYGKVADNVKAGVRIASGSSKTPTSTNQTLDDNASEKNVWIDLAYITVDCPKGSGLSATFGKMKQPWVQVSDLIFDTDVNPEGISATHTCGSGLPITTVVGYHIMDEDKGDDVELVSGQVSTVLKLEEDIKLSIGAGAFIFNNIERIEPIGYDIIDGFAKLDIKKGPAPIKVFAEYLNNTSEDDDNTAWIVGVGTKIKDVKVSYNYRDLEANSVWGDLDDGDFGGPDGKGHKIKAKYGLFANTTVGATYFRTEHSGVDEDLLQLDLAVKF